MALQGRTQTINCTDCSIVDNIRVCQFNYDINSDEPENMNMTRSILDMNKYKACRVQVAKDQAAFEEAAFKFQDELIAQKNAATEGGEK